MTYINEMESGVVQTGQQRHKDFVKGNYMEIADQSDFNILNSDIGDDFIGVFDTDFDGTHMINFFHNMKNSNQNLFDGHYMRRNTQSLEKVALHLEDEAVFLEMSQQKQDSFNVSMNTRVLDSYNKIIAKCYAEYAKKYTILYNMKGAQYTVNIQKTEPGEGYHVWHHEVESIQSSTRYLDSMLYLNDVVAGGETEFLHQHRRVQPKKGRVVLWPSQWTHTHRGNPPLKGKKYIATSWIHFAFV